MICAKEAWENKQTIMIGDEEMEKKAGGFSTGRYQADTISETLRGNGA